MHFLNSLDKINVSPGYHRKLVYFEREGVLKTLSKLNHCFDAEGTLVGLSYERDATQNKKVNSSYMDTIFFSVEETL